MKIEEIEKLRYDVDGGLPWPSAYKVERLCVEVSKLLAVAKAAKELSDRHDWSLDMGQCICDQHKAFKEALADLERE